MIGPVILVLNTTTPTGGKRFVVWNRRTGFQQRCRTVHTAARIEHHFARMEAIAFTPGPPQPE